MSACSASLGKLKRSIFAELSAPAAILLAMTVGGCSASLGSATVRPQLPAMPAKTAAACPPPAFRGASKMGWAEQATAAYAACRERHANAVGFYDDVRKRFGGGK